MNTSEFFYVDDLADACLFLLKKYNQKIKILEELRKSTIAHVVTGKLRLVSDINE